MIIGIIIGKYVGFVWLIELNNFVCKILNFEGVSSFFMKVDIEFSLVLIIILIKSISCKFLYLLESNYL